MQIKAEERIKELGKFYVGKVTNAALIEDALPGGQMSEEAKGLWATDQILKAARTLHVEEFIVAIEGENGMEIPEIPNMEEYVRAFRNLESLHVKGVRETIPIRERAEGRARKALADAETMVADKEDNLAKFQKIRNPSMDQKEALEGNLKSLEVAFNVVEEAQQKWQAEHTNLLHNIKIVEDWERGAVKAARVQFDLDSDAHRQLLNALALLKKFVSGVMLKVPSVGTVIRQMGENLGDPYELSDMRRCYSNLVARFRKSEALDVATSVILAIKDTQQGNESLGTFARRTQEFYQEMIRMGVTQISMADLSAVILIAGMKEGLRKLFMQSETTLALALDNMDDDLGIDDDTATVRSRARRSLSSKTLRFVAKQEEEELMLNKLAGRKSGGVSGGDANKDVHKRVKEAQLAFATAVRAADKHACYEFARSGSCARGDACTFKHIGSSGSEKQGARAQLFKGGECFEFAMNGTCKFGNTCRFKHSSKGTGSINANTGTTASAGTGASGGGQKPVTSISGTSKVGGAGGNKAASRVLYAEEGAGYESNDSEEVDVVLARARSAVACATVEHNGENGDMVGILGWDSMCSLHVANSLDVIPGAAPLKKAKEAVGMGGVKPITHKGHSPMFGKIMSYIEGGGTPNLLSVGQECQQDASGMQGMVLFSATGAVRFRVTPQLRKEFITLVDKVEALGLVKGQAVLANNVYKEAFGVSGQLEPEKVQRTGQDSAFAINHNMFASRVHMDSTDAVLDFMVASGLTKHAIIEGIKTQSLRGIPQVIEEHHVKGYFKRLGKTPEQLEADITKATLRQPVDFEDEKTVIPGAVMQLDNIDPSFSRMAEKDKDGDIVKSANGTAAHKKVVPSVGGYKDAVIAVDEASGYAHLVGRTSKKDPHKVLAQFMGKWRGRWGTLSIVKGDKEFLTHESAGLLHAWDVRFRQAVPGDHRRTTSMVEGSIRWLLELAQANMNRLRKWVKAKVITEHQSRTLWFHALRQAVFVFNFRPSLCDPIKTRYEVGTGDVANLSHVVLMPFGMRVMGKNLLASADGRGSECLYIGPSSTVRGGILTYSLETERVSVKYAFIPIADVKRPGEAQTRSIGKGLYGKMADIPVTVEVKPQQKTMVPGWEDVAGFGENKAANVDGPVKADIVDGSVFLGPGEQVRDAVANQETPGQVVTSDQPLMVEQGQLVDLFAEAVPAVPEEVPIPVSPPAPVPVPAPVPAPDLSDLGQSIKSGGGVKAKVKKVVVSDYKTRSRAAFNVEEKSERPPKPKVPPSKVCDDCPRWKSAEQREAKKLMEENTTVPLPRDTQGKEYRPEGAMVLRLLKIREFKWKPDPVTGVEGWLECVRLVCDGSVDKRPEKYYAETPDRTLLMLMTSMEASKGIAATGSDVTRAYLNAESIDRNIVIVAPQGLEGFPRQSLLNKGLYGSRGGALSWQVWIDDKMKDLEYRKMDVCRGVYTKEVANGELMRAYRHSDDFRLSCSSNEARVEEENKLRAVVRMAEFSNLERFLGCTFQKVDRGSGESAVVLVRQKEKIMEMKMKFGKLHTKHNRQDRLRKTPLPVDAIKWDEELGEEMGALLSVAGIEEYQSLVGCIQWVVNCTRPDAKLGGFLLATRMSKPREWDMYLAVYVMDYLIATVEAPLVLGGDEMDPIVYADASFATLPERRSIMGHVAFSGKGSGALYAQVGSTKTAVTSIWEAELMAGCAGMDTAIYLTQACKELGYDVPSCRVVKVDNKAEVDWIKGSVSNKRSRHVDVRFYRARHLQEEKEISAEYVPTEDNVADMLTKPLAVREFRKFAKVILGHGLVENMGVDGIFE
jgi:hypothetical protein